MSVFLLSLFLLLILALIVLGLVYARFSRLNILKQKQLQKEISDLNKELETEKAELVKNMNTLKEAHGSAQFETYANLIVSQMNQGVICIDQNRLIKMINTYAGQFLDASSAIEKPYQQVFHIQKSNGTDDYSNFEAAFTGKTQVLPDNLELVSQRGKFPIRGSIVPLTIDNTVKTIVFIFADNRKQIEQVKEEQAFFSSIAHELRTPLTIIRLTVSLLRNKFDTLGREKIIEHLKMTDETTERLANLVNDFLNISRIDQGRLDVKIEPFDMMSLISEVVQELTLLARERKLYIQHEPISSEYHTVVGDRTKTREVLLNLLSNSLKYTIQGGITITHRVVDFFLATQITDTGTGISPEYQNLLFKRFLQVGKARLQASTKSSGLGLYISKKFAQLMRGDVVLEKSEPGKGSTFTLTLPLR